MKTTEQLNEEKKQLLEEVKRRELEKEVKQLRKKAGKQGLLSWVAEKLGEILSAEKEEKE